MIYDNMTSNANISSETLRNLVENSKNENICDEQIEQLNKTDEEFINEHNEEISKSSEYRGMMMYNNYIHSQESQGTIFTGKQKRVLKRKFLRDAKKGKYDYIFDEEKIKRRQERAAKDFESLNKPVKHSVNDLDDNVKDTLLDMENKEPWNELKPE